MKHSTEICTFYYRPNVNPAQEKPFVEETCKCNCGHEFEYLAKCPNCGNMEWDNHTIHSFHGTWDYLELMCLCCGLTMAFRLEDPYHPRWGKTGDRGPLRIALAEKEAEERRQIDERMT
jgi:hypothetical protein